MYLRTALLAATCALAACTTTYQRRGIENPQPWQQAAHLDDFESPEGDPALQERVKVARRLDAEARSVERYYIGDRSADRRVAPRFSLNVIEISDEGEFNPAQYTQVMRNLRCELSLADPDATLLTVAAENRCGELDGKTMAQTALDPRTSQAPSTGTLLVVFVHGWHHGCATCDRDITCYRSVLKSLAEAEAALGTGRRVVGLYVGWRGRALRGNYLFGQDVDYLSIWNRKRTAEHLGRTAGKELLNDLNALWMGHQRVTMVTVGHSLGGAFLLSAARGRLTGSVADVVRGTEAAQRAVRADGSRAEALTQGHKAIRSRFGDVVVLLNPAIEAEEWRVFDEDLYDKSLEERLAKTGADRDTWPEQFMRSKLPMDKAEPYHPDQLPVMIAIGSVADGAVGKFFPASRFIAGLNPFDADALVRRDERIAVGHFDRHVTHKLTAEGEDREGDPNYDMRTCTCPKGARSRSEKTGDAEVEVPSAVTTAAQAPSDPRDFFNQAVPPPPARIWQISLAKSRDCDREQPANANAACTRGWDRKSPYIVVQADAKVIGAHSDVFNPVVVTFLQEYIASYLTYRRNKGDQDEKTGH